MGGAVIGVVGEVGGYGEFDTTLAGANEGADLQAA